MHIAGRHPCFTLSYVDYEGIASMILISLQPSELFIITSSQYCTFEIIVPVCESNCATIKFFQRR